MHVKIVFYENSASSLIAGSMQTDFIGKGPCNIKCYNIYMMTPSRREISEKSVIPSYEY